LDAFPDWRTGKKSQYEMADAGVGAFSVFFIQCASFLEDQAAMKRTKGGRNAQGLVERMNLPSDNQIRGLLDSSLPKLLRPMDRIIFQRVEQAGKRWISAHGGYYAKRNVTLLGDDLFSRQPFLCYRLHSTQYHIENCCLCISWGHLHHTMIIPFK